MSEMQNPLEALQAVEDEHRLSVENPRIYILLLRARADLMKQATLRYAAEMKVIETAIEAQELRVIILKCPYHSFLRWCSRLLAKVSP